MNTQEVIDEIKKIQANAVSRSHVSLHPLYADGVADTCSDVIKFLEQLDKPQRVKVKPYVAEWFEKNKDDLEFKIWRYIRRWNEHPKDEFQMFMNDGPSKPIETLIRMQDGYEVEEEPEWVVRAKEMFFLNWGEDGTCPTFVIDDNPGAKRSAKRFIKSEAQSLAESLHGSIEKV